MLLELVCEVLWWARNGRMRMGKRVKMTLLVSTAHRAGLIARHDDARRAWKGSHDYDVAVNRSAVRIERRLTGCQW